MSVFIPCADDAAVREVVNNFQSCSCALEEFTHAHHITVAVWFLSEWEFEAAMEQMRSDLLKFGAHHKKMGYNETITRFWLLLVQQFLSASEPGLSIATLANEAVERFADKNLIFLYYSRERVMSEEAKRQWLEPDLRAL